MLLELANARQAELRVAETRIAHRMTWAQIARVDRLERALKVAQGRLQMLPTLFPKAN
ncbi:MAG: hypothetical protein M9925_09075 [Chloroflexi bacterium]|nr:hypothetical protein [Dehalococcoidia bacterium]MCO5201834.1 hypothetical protein [Chloroflexota bacterium]MCZ7577184.1 hypothetical protein [Dehalococcoidia bacterium]